MSDMQVREGGWREWHAMPEADVRVMDTFERILVCLSAVQHAGINQHHFICALSKETGRLTSKMTLVRN